MLVRACGAGVGVLVLFVWVMVCAFPLSQRIIRTDFIVHCVLAVVLSVLAVVTPRGHVCHSVLAVVHPPVVAACLAHRPASRPVSFGGGRRVDGGGVEVVVCCELGEVLHVLLAPVVVDQHVFAVELFVVLVDLLLLVHVVPLICGVEHRVALCPLARLVHHAVDLGGVEAAGLAEQAQVRDVFHLFVLVHEHVVVVLLFVGGGGGFLWRLRVLCFCLLAGGDRALCLEVAGCQ